MNKLLIVSLAVGLSLGSAQAVTLAPGTMETRVSGQFDSTTANGTLFDLNVSYGYFFQDNLQAGGRVGFYDNDNVTLYSALAFVEYNFEIGSEDWLPYVEFALGLSKGDGEGGVDETAITTELQGGIKYFLAPNVALSGGLVLNYASEEIYPDEKNYEDNDARLQLAIRYYY